MASSEPKKAAPKSAVDQAAYGKVAKNGNVQSRAEVENKFKADYAAKYQNKFDKEPATRPTYIPRTYNNHTIVYNSGYGGYGYYNGGAWIAYDVMRDAAMMSVLMSNHGYHYQQPVVYTSHGGYGFLIFFSCLGLFALIMVFAFSRN